MKDKNGNNYEEGFHENVYEAIRRDGTQKNVVDTMQTREELYQRINYYSYENALDALNQDAKK